MLNRIGGIIGWLGTALVFAAVAIRFLRPEWMRYAYWGAWAGLVCVLVYTLTQWRDIAGAFRRRQTRLGSLTLASILIVLGILVAINYLGTRQNKRWDLTADSQFTLSDQTKNVLSRLDTPLKVYVFDKVPDIDRFRDRLREYEYLSRHVSVEYVDIDKQPTLGRQFSVQSYGTVVFEYKARTERVVGDREQDLTNAIIKVVTGTQRKIYFVQGHGERDPLSAERTGYSTVKSALEAENYLVDKVVLVQTGAVPDDAAALIVAGPRTDLLAPEMDAIRAYLAKGGKLLVMLDPPDKPSDPPLGTVTALLRDWGIAAGTNLVVDVSGIGRLIGTNESVPVVAQYPTHPITERFNVLTAFPVTRSMEPVSGAPDNRVAQPLLETSANSWAEADVAAMMKGGEVAFDADKGDKQGPVTIGAAVEAAVGETSPGPPGEAEAPKTETRLVAIGDSDFAANFAVPVQGNRDLFLNVVGWLTQQENLISIRPKEPGDRRLTLTADQGSRIAWLAQLIIPGALFALGIVTWWRRR
ncbi:MAG: Gldg family protein [Acidobacteriota bacterium]